MSNIKEVKKILAHLTDKWWSDKFGVWHCDHIGDRFLTEATHQIYRLFEPKVECQERVERIIKEIEKNPFQYFKPSWDKANKEYDGGIELRDRWQALKKQEGVK